MIQPINYLFPRQNRFGKPPKRTYKRVLAAQVRRAKMSETDRLRRRAFLREAGGLHALARITIIRMVLSEV